MRRRKPQSDEERAKNWAFAALFAEVTSQYKHRLVRWQTGAVKTLEGPDDEEVLDAPTGGQSDYHCRVNIL